MRAVAKKSPRHAGSPALLALGDAVRHYRIQAGLSQEALAAVCGLDRTYVSGIERGKRNVGLVNIQRIATALDTTISNLFEDEY